VHSPQHLLFGSCGFSGARYFEAADADGNLRILMRWQNGCIWSRVPSHEIDPRMGVPWAWIPIESLPFRRREISVEEANLPPEGWAPPSESTGESGPRREPGTDLLPYE